MIEVYNFLTAGAAPPEEVKTLWETLFTDQLPATLTFISALLGIISQLVLSNLSNYQSRKADKKKNQIVSIQKFYIPLFYLLSEYKLNLDVLRKVKNFDLYDSTSSDLNAFQTNLNEVCSVIEKLSDYSLEDYYPVNSKINKKIHDMFINMELSSKILQQPLTERKKLCSLYGLPVTGYDVTELINEIWRMIK